MRPGPEVLSVNEETNRWLKRMGLLAAALGLIFNLVVAAGVAGLAARSAASSRAAERQSLVNSRDLLIYRRDFALSRDCPVEYFRQLLVALQVRADLTAVVPPCEPEDLDAIDEQLAEVEAQIADGGR